MVGVESDPNWVNVKSPRITSVVRLSHEIQGDAVLLLPVVHCANESAFALPPYVSRQTRLHLVVSSEKQEDFFFLPPLNIVL